jgi:hypothetical protein
VLPGIRWPFIGTSLIVAGKAGWLAVRPIAARTDWLNFECHGIDLTDHESDGIAERLRTQPDQRVPLSSKWPLFVRVMEDLVRSHDVRTLGEWAEQPV